MLRVGLTGGLASGKTTVANLFSALGTPVINADDITRELMQKGEPAYHDIFRHFGPAILNTDRTLNRAKLRHIIAHNQDEKIWLERCLHPKVRSRIEEKLSSINADYVIIEIPLLIETLPNPLIDRILLISTTREIQLERAIRRDQTDKGTLERLIDHQVSDDIRQQYADDKLFNQGDLSDLESEVKMLHQQYLQLAKGL